MALAEERDEHLLQDLRPADDRATQFRRQLPVKFGALLGSLQILVIDLPKCPPYGSARSTVNSTIRKSPARTAAGS